MLEKRPGNDRKHVRKMSRKCPENCQKMSGKCPEVAQKIARKCPENVQKMSGGHIPGRIKKTKHKAWRGSKLPCHKSCFSCLLIHSFLYHLFF